MTRWTKWKKLQLNEFYYREFRDGSLKKVLFAPWERWN